MISDDFQIGPNGAYEHVGNQLDLDYQDLLQDILDNGVKKETRNGGTISVFGRQIRHNMQDGFPLLTTKKMAWKTMVTELLWFLRGDTNIKFLVDNNCHIWDGDAYKNYSNYIKEEWESGAINELWEDDLIVEESNDGKNVNYRLFTKEEFINKIKTDDDFAEMWGELGPIYGKQWRSWGRKNIVNYDLENVKSSDKVKVMDLIRDGKDYSKYDVKVTYQNNSIDQIANLINELKTNPDSRRLMVSAWNVGELDQMVLPPCHYGFQVYTRELSARERTALGSNGSTRLYDAIKERNYETIDADVEMHKVCDDRNIPRRAISLMWNQRSVDTFLGLPFNIASYGLLLEIIAKEVNMVPDELIGNLGDVHLYSNHIEQAKEQIGRTPYELPKLEMTPWMEYMTPGTNNSTMTFDSLIQSLEPSDFDIKDYQSHPTIKAPLSN